MLRLKILIVAKFGGELEILSIFIKLQAVKQSAADFWSTSLYSVA